MLVRAVMSGHVAAALVGSAVLLALGAAPGTAANGRETGDVEARKRQLEAAGATAVTGDRNAGQRDSATVDLIVGYKDGVTAARRLDTAGVDPSLVKLGARAVTVPRADSAAVTAALRADPDVAYVEQDATVRAGAVVPNDPFYAGQDELAQITVPDAWSVTTGAAVTVAVLDTGVSPVGDLAGAVLTGRDLVNNDTNAADDQGHGTAVASVIAARGNNRAGMAGVCWSCRILPVKVLDANGNGQSSKVAAGIVYAADQGAKIINASLAGATGTTVLRDAVAYAQKKGSLVVASAGNDALKNPHYPAAYPGAIAVGGTDGTSDIFLTYDPVTWEIIGSNHGPDWVDVAAPWCAVAADLQGLGTSGTADDYGPFCGTSFSAPLVAGTIALMKSKHPKATNTALVYALTATAKPTPTTGFTRHGEIRAGRAVTTVDTTAPRITGSTPKQSARIRGAVTVQASGVSDTGSGVAYAALYANGNYVGRDTTAPYAVRYPSAGVNGAVTLQWRVFDRAGNRKSYDRRVTADNRGPAVKITKAPRNGAKVGATVAITVSAKDAAGVRHVEVLVNGKVAARDPKSPYTFRIKTAEYGKKLTVRIRALDKVGNTTTTAVRTWKR